MRSELQLYRIQPRPAQSAWQASVWAAALLAAAWVAACADEPVVGPPTAAVATDAAPGAMAMARAGDRDILVALYNATDGPNWFNDTNWLTDAPLGDWHGVRTDAVGRVTELNLAENGLSGSIPSDLGQLARLDWLDLADNHLSGPIPADLGRLANLVTLLLDHNELTGSIPRSFGDLANVFQMNLANNELSGTIPAELGGMVNLEYAQLQGNDLTGTIPSELGNLTELVELFLGGNHGLCAPGTRRFVTWLQGIRYVEGLLYCNKLDAKALEDLHRTGGGSSWMNSDGWLGDVVLEDWYGVETDSIGRVTVLDLAENGLAGRLPASVGNLASMTRLEIGDNPDLSGRLPTSLSRTPLDELRYMNTGLCAPVEAWFEEWLGGLAQHEGTGVQCPPLSDREILEILYEATGGRDWYESDNWLTDAPLDEWHGVFADGDRVKGLHLYGNNLAGPIPLELGSLADLEGLFLSGNELTGPIPLELGSLADLGGLSLANNYLTGPIPGELGNLTKLHSLALSINHLTGPIPSELGNLTNLSEALRLSDNELTGPIPVELGNLTKLTRLDLSINHLTGPIPSELGNLTNLSEALRLSDNELTGPIPRELGNLTKLTGLDLQFNELTGPIPSELGNLSTLELLDLSNNDLSGPVPAKFGGMSSLETLALTNNPQMQGALPSELTGLTRLEALLAGDTGLCAPLTLEFEAWLARVHTRRLALCSAGPPPMAYLIQVAQSREFPVPLVAGRRALLRVFPTASRATDEGIPPVRARLYLDGRETHVENIPGKSTPIPTEMNEGSLLVSANAEIPGHLVHTGLEMVIEVDPDGTLDPELGVAKRIPATGRLAVEVRAMPVFELTLIPFIWSEAPDSSIVDVVEAMAADPGGHEALRDVNTLLPVGDFAVRAHEPVLSSTNAHHLLLRQTEAIRVMEGGTGHYYGTISWQSSDGWGVAMNPGRSAYSVVDASTIAHELGHNMSLDHAPCGVGGDPSFPTHDGSSGVWGYDFDAGRLVSPGTPDLMSYCGPPNWISDYHFSNALRYRLFDAGVAGPAGSLLLWGGIGTDSLPFLEPAFVVDAPTALPDSAGQYRLTGQSDSGVELFSLAFAMPETADGDGSSSFAFAVPVQAGWEGNLASITLTGPGGSFTLDGESDQPVAILRNPRNGQIRGILRGPAGPTLAAMDSATSQAGPGLEVLFSYGIPDVAAWNR